MNSWFTADGTPAAFLPTFKLPGENQSNSTSKTAGRLAAVIRAIDPDILALQEAPNSGTIHHAEYKAQIKNAGKKREERPSDHRPVSVELEY